MEPNVAFTFITQMIGAGEDITNIDAGEIPTSVMVQPSPVSNESFPDRIRDVRTFPTAEPWPMDTGAFVGYQEEG